MAKILLLNPSKMGSGYTPIWIASHSGLLKKHGNDIKLFDASLYKKWSDDCVKNNTENQMYRQSDYEKYIELKETDVYNDLQNYINKFQPDFIFWGAISSHIHSEGEYVNIQYGYDLLKNIATKAIKIAAGIQPTADPNLMLEIFPKIEYLIRGESEFVFREIAERYDRNISFDELHGLAYKKNDEVFINPHQNIIADMDMLGSYDYSIFEDQVFYRSYNGKVFRAIDYELSRGCPYTCDYCVEPVIQKYYGFSKRQKNGILKEAKQYLRSKSSKKIFAEIQKIHKEQNITYFRCQDTNFLTIPHKTLNELADYLQISNLPIFLYIETRPESINSSTVSLLKRLNVDGVGMGLETASEEFRRVNLNRFTKQDDIIDAFRLLKDAGIKRTTYNIIGLRGETEEMILETIRFNQLLEPDNISTAFYSPYIGSLEQERSVKEGYFNSYEYNLDSDIRSVTKSKLVSKEKLEFYRKHFTELVRIGLERLPHLKKIEGIK